MGMAASQARLLTITGRMHDTEYKAQNIMNQKIALGTRKDDLYKDYCDALDATKIQVAYTDGIKQSYVDATFSTLCKYDKNRCTDYALIDSNSGKVLVNADAARLYNEEGFDTDKYAFAWAMLGMEDMGTWSGERNIDSIGIGTCNETGDENGNIGDLVLSEAEEKAYEILTADGGNSELSSLYEEVNTILADSNSTNAEKRDVLNKFREKLYSNSNMQTLYDCMRLDKDDENNTDPMNGEFDGTYPDNFDELKPEFDYYIHLFECIQQAGGCIDVNTVAEDGNTGNEWFNQMINSGAITIQVYNDRGTNKGWSDTRVGTTITDTHLQEVKDEADLKKAEATYEYELGIVNDKDKKFDQDLQKLETERNSLKTEMDAIKTIIKDNQDRTFNTFN
jgi:hypothetical protein